MADDGRGNLIPLSGAAWWKEAGREDKLRELWPQRDISTSQIAKLIGDGCNKNMVISKAHRLLLGTRDPDYGGPAPRPKPQLGWPGAGQCAYPIGHPGEEGFHFCGEAVAAVGKPYCADHTTIARQGKPAQGKQPKTEPHEEFRW